MQNVIKHASEVLAPYNVPNVVPPHPSFALQLNDEIFSGSNLYAVQKSFDGPFQFDIFFEEANTKQKLSGNESIPTPIASNLTFAPLHFTALTLDEGIKALVESYDKRFNEVFPVPKTIEVSDLESLKNFSKAITSNLIGGIGYFYGTSIVDKGFAYEWDQDDDVADEADKKGEKGARITEPKALLTATPSRSFFPRGFYWSVEIDQI